ncbi:MAG: hypothetical protein KIT31_22355, partial [Deltaproteobacteria bacterium]|nr:hypothetical protein [Deltaproteobacteria bacterium]
LAAPSLAAPNLAAPNLATPNLAAPNLAPTQLAAPNLAPTQLAAPNLAASHDADDLDAQETSLRMDEFTDEAATVLDADGLVIAPNDHTDVMDAVFVGDDHNDLPTSHDTSGPRRARADYDDSRRLARGSSVAMHTSEIEPPRMPPELLRSTLRIEEVKPHPYVTARLRRS